VSPGEWEGAVMNRLAWCVAGLVAGAAMLWALSPQGCVVLGNATARPPCPTRFGLSVPFPVLWALAVLTAAAVTAAGFARAKRRSSEGSAR
jgi:hypothetical protein